MVQRQMVVVSSESNAHELIGVFREREYIHGKIGNAASIQCQDLNTTKPLRCLGKMAMQNM